MTEFEAELKARRFVQETGVTKVPVDLSRYLERISSKVSLDELDSNEAGYTMATSKGALITLNTLDRAARRRFTLCHEIAHLVLGLPSDHSHGPEWSYAKRPLNEVCCDVFAAELLLPVNLFTNMVKDRSIDFDTVDYLRVEMFASREATASRLAATSKLACAYLLSESGKIQHIVRSPPLRNAKAWIPRGSPLPAGSAAYALRTGESQFGTRTYSGDLWFDGWRDVEMAESSVYISDYDQTLTLLCCTDQDELDELSWPTTAEHATDDDGLLKPLDGQLEWPSTRKRR
jgi:Zn-dependent peptidase ImmA (M78 family)